MSYLHEKNPKEPEISHYIFSSKDRYFGPTLEVIELTFRTARNQNTPIHLTSEEANKLILNIIAKAKDLESHIIKEDEISGYKLTVQDVLFEVLAACHLNKVDPKIIASPLYVPKEDESSDDVEVDVVHSEAVESKTDEKDEADKAITKRSLDKILLYVLMYECVFCGYQLSSAKDLTFLPAPSSVSKRHAKADESQELGKILSAEQLPIFVDVLSNLFAYFINEWRYFIRYAEENEILLDLTAMHAGKRILELAIQSEKLMTLNAILAYASRNNIKVDMAEKNNDGDSLIDLVLNDQVRLNILIQYIDVNPKLVVYDEKNRYEALRVLGQYDRVWGFYVDKTDPESLHVKCKILQEQKKLSEAQDLCELMIKAHPNFADGYYCKAILLVDQQKYQDALDLLDRAITVNPHNPLYDINKVKIYLELGQKDKVIETLEAIDIKIATRYINRLFTPSQKELFIQMTQVAEKFVTQVPEEKGVHSRKTPQVIIRVIQAFNRGIKINFSEANALRKELEDLKAQLFNVDEKVSDVQVQLSQNKIAVNKRLTEVERRVSNLENWLTKLHKQVSDLKPENQEIKEKLVLLQVSLQKTLKEQEKQQSQQIHFQKQIASLRGQIDTMDDVKKINSLQEKIKSLEADLVQLGTALPVTDVSAHLSSLREEFLTFKKGSEQIAKFNSSLRTQLQEVIDESGRQAEQFARWQKELDDQVIHQNKQQQEAVNELQAQFSQAKIALSMRIAALEDKDGEADTLSANSVKKDGVSKGLATAATRIGLLAVPASTSVGTRTTIAESNAPAKLS